MFNAAFYSTMHSEGDYSNRSSDRGGETYFGISRVFHPNWEGWNIIDSYKGDDDFIDNIRINAELFLKVKRFYEINYWNINKLSQISLSKDLIANELFDIGVNMGVETAAKFLQQAINYLNRNEKNYKNILVDGDIGPKTLDALDKLNSIKDEAYLLKLIILLKAKRYIDIIDKDESQEIFIRGWLNRITI